MSIFGNDGSDNSFTADDETQISRFMKFPMNALQSLLMMAKGNMNTSFDIGNGDGYEDSKSAVKRLSEAITRKSRGN